MPRDRSGLLLKNREEYLDRPALSLEPNKRFNIAHDFRMNNEAAVGGAIGSLSESEGAQSHMPRWVAWGMGSLFAKIPTGHLGSLRHLAPIISFLR